MSAQRNALISSVLCGVILSLGSCLQRADDAIERASSTRISQETAIERVLQAVGLPKEQLTITASRVALPDKVLPCVTSPRNRRAWSIRLDHVTLTEKDGTRPVTNPYISSLVVTLSCETGQVTTIVSPHPEGDSSVWPFPSVESYETQLRRTSSVFTALPQGPPKITFAQAIQQALGGFANAKQIIAYYVVERSTLPQIHERAVWMIHLRGMPPYTLSYPRGVPDDEGVEGRNHLRSTIDAETGGFLGANNLPQPDGP